MSIREKKKLIRAFARLGTLAGIPTLFFASNLLAATTPKPSSSQKSQELTLIHLSDYHSHAIPFFNEGKFNQAGIARAVAFLRQERKRDSSALVFLGGDMMNIGSPAWSDKFRCSDWKWFDGLVDAMALGNHELDYGYEEVSSCIRQAQFPTFSANLVYTEPKTEAGPKAVFTTREGKPYLVIERQGLKLGILARSGADFSRLINPKNLPAGAKFVDSIPLIREMVAQLKDREKANAIILIGHSSYEEDMKLAQEVPGIDFIFGTHSHRQEDLMRIPGTPTWYIAPHPYLISAVRVKLQFKNGKMSDVSGSTIPMSDSQPQASDIQKEAETWQKKLEADPRFSERFQKIGKVEAEISNRDLYNGESPIGDFVLDIIRRKTGAHAAFSTASSFRSSLPPGDLTLETYLAALPFKNSILTLELSGKRIREILRVSLSKRSSDGFSQFSGIKVRAVQDKIEEIRILRDPKDEKQGFIPLEDEKLYLVNFTDYQAKIAEGYRDICAQASKKTETPYTINDLVIEHIRAHSPVSGTLDGRLKFE